jgi:hypothetical protein
VLGLSVIFMAVLPGCPFAGSMVEGTWKMFLDESCNTSIDGYYGFVLNSNGTAEWHIANLFLGTWELNGNTITVNFTTPGAAMFTGAISLDGTEITDGTFSVTDGGSGCFAAEKLEF